MHLTFLKLRNAFFLMVFSLSVLTFLRAVLYYTQQEYFSPLTSQELLNAFLMGVRVDLVILSVAFIPVALFYFLPFKFTFSSRCHNLFFYYWYLIVGFIVFFIAADIIYFDYVQRHIAGEISIMGDDKHLLFDMLLLHSNAFLSFLFGMLLLYFLFKKILKKPKDQSSFSWKGLAVFLVVIVLTLLGIRSSLSGKPLGISDAFTSSKLQSGNLSLNGLFTMAKTLSKTSKNYSFYSAQEALKTSRELLSSNSFEFSSEQYPLAREARDLNKTKYNVVIVMLESWSAKYIDSFAGTHFGVTPNFDAIAREGLMFTNFFANGQRSIDGLTALLTGTPKLPGFEYLGHGLELNPLSYLGTMAQNNDYDTLFMQSSKRGSFRIDSIAKIAGFEHYYGAEDIPDLALEESGKQPKFGTWDNNMLQYFAQQTSKLKEPFLSFAFTSSTHAPFVSPGKKWEQYEHDEGNIYGFFNTLKYSDEALGAFMTYAKKQEWFDRTLFIFTADHTLGFGDDTQFAANETLVLQQRELENLRIPLLMYAPGIFKEHKRIDTLSSQADLLPTLVDFLGWSGAFTSLSHSLFGENNQRFVVFSYGDILGFKEERGYVIHTLEREIENSIGKDSTQKILSLYQVYSTLLKENSLLRSN